MSDREEDGHELWLTWDEDDGSAPGTLEHFALWLRRQRVEALAMTEQAAVGMAQTAGTGEWSEWADRLEEGQSAYRYADEALELLKLYCQEEATRCK